MTANDVLIVLGVGVPTGVAWQIYWLAFDAKKRRQSACAHRWEYHSLWNEGKLWNRVCVDCGKQEPCPPPSDDQSQ